MTPQVRRSFAWCERVARTKAANFYPAFRLLPRRQFLDLCALYAFLRVADDLADDDGEPDDKRRWLDEYRCQLDLALAGSFHHPLYPAFADTVHTNNIPVEYLHAALDGVGMDLDVTRYDTFEDLYRYCFRVASVVGLSCIHIWGFMDESAKQYAESAGIAFQLTNILRDVAEDAHLGRIYLPQEDLDRFGYTREQLMRGEGGKQFEELMTFQAQRARRYYDAAMPLVPLLRPGGRAVFLVMMRTYRGLLEKIVASGFDVFRQRIRVSRWYKLGQVLRALPVRWGITSR